MSKLPVLALASLVLAHVAVPAQADALSDAYRGKNITFLVGSDPGGSFGPYAQVLAEDMHLEYIVKTFLSIYLINIPAAKILERVILQHDRNMRDIELRSLRTVHHFTDNSLHLPANTQTESMLLVLKNIHATPDFFKIIGEVIEDGYLRSTTRLGEQCDNSLTRIGFSLRPGLTSYQLAVALGSLVEGLSLRLRYDRDVSNELTTSEDGKAQSWGLPGLCFEALVDRFYQ